MGVPFSALHVLRKLYPKYEMATAEFCYFAIPYESNGEDRWFESFAKRVHKDAS